MKRLAKKDKGAFLCTCVLNIHSGCVLDHLLLFWRKGPQTRRDTKPDKHYADCSRCFLYSYSTSYPGGTEKLLLWVTALAQSCLPSGSGWCWTPPGNPQCTGAGRLLGQHFSSPTGWAASSVPAQNCQSLAGGSHSSAMPPLPWQRVLWAWASLPFHGAKQHSYFSVLLRHLNFCACWSSFQSCESISAVPLLKTKHNQDRLWFF